MNGQRHLPWGGLVNARDLGGLPVCDGRTVRYGAVVRSEAPSRVTDDGWRALHAHGVRTIVDLRNPGEGEGYAPPGDVTVIRTPLDDVADTVLWTYLQESGLDGTPLYLLPFLRAKPDRCVQAVRSVAHAPEGGVLVHCAGGRDRTGLVTLMLLTLVGVPPADIAADYVLSAMRMREVCARHGVPYDGPLIDEVMARHGRTAEEAVRDLLAELDVAAFLGDAGLAEADVAALRRRLL